MGFGTFYTIKVPNFDLITALKQSLKLKGRRELILHQILVNYRPIFIDAKWKIFGQITALLPVLTFFQK